LRKRLQPEKAAERLVNFLKAMAEEIKMLTMLSGHDDIHQLSKEDLRALDINVAAITGVKLVGSEKIYP
ncbi:MAG: FMN-binding glutamate synthase family protein, partial [Thermoproteota archaeon]